MWLNTQTEFINVLGAATRSTAAFADTPSNRFDVYRNNVSVSLREALSDAFPVVRKLVGEDFFYAMAQDYIKQNRPASPVLLEYGATFGDFIETFEPAQNIPYLADIARFERKWLDSYHAADVTPTNITTLQKIDADQYDELVFILHPALIAHQSAWPAATIWLAHQNNDAPDLSGLEINEEYILITRPELDVLVESVSQAMLRFVEHIGIGQPLRIVCERLHDLDGFNPSQHLAHLFSIGGVIDVVTQPSRQEA